MGLALKRTCLSCSSLKHASSLQQELGRKYGPNSVLDFCSQSGLAGTTGVRFNLCPAPKRADMPSFQPVHTDEQFRLGVSFGENERASEAMSDDVLERMVNRCAVNVFAFNRGCASPRGLDELCWDRLITAAPGNLHREQTHYFSRCAAGKPRLRRIKCERGRPVQTLTRYLELFGENAISEFNSAVQWAFFTLIHPDQLTPMEVNLAIPFLGDCSAEEWGRLITIESLEEQAGELFKAIAALRIPAVPVTALWRCLRASVLAGDLRQYALFYDTWLRCKPSLAKSPMFANMTDELFRFTAVWFGQIEISIDPFLPPMSSGFANAARRALSSLREDPKQRIAAKDLWKPFRLYASDRHEGLLVRPRSDIFAFGKPNAAEARRPTDLMNLPWFGLQPQPLPRPPAIGFPFLRPN